MMNQKGIWTRALLALLCLLAVVTLAACSAETEIGQNTDLGRQFLDYVIQADYASAYGMVQSTVSDGDFRAYWNEMQTVVEGAQTYELEQIGWNIHRSGGITTYATAYQVYFDNQKTVLFRVVTTDDIEGIAGLHFSDVTEFLNHSESFVPTLQVVLGVVSLLTIAFCIWMFVDCLRRKMRYKVLWAILILVGVAVTVTTGQTMGLNFTVGLMLQSNTVVADPSILSMVTKVVIPLGAILYLCLRKRFTVVPSQPVEAEEAPVSDGYTVEGQTEDQNDAQ